MGQHGLWGNDVHATLKKFGYPVSLLHDTEHWCVLLRPQQVTLGSLVLCAKSNVGTLGELGTDAFAELGQVTTRIEKALNSFRPYDKINYLALMMVDPHVHFHVLPRYGQAQEYGGVSFADVGWPGVPDLKSGTAMEDALRLRLYAELLDAFRRAG